MIQTFDPIRTLVNTRNGSIENLKISSSYLAVGVGAGTSIIAANATKIHRIVGWHLSAGLAGNTGFILRNGAAGANLLGINIAAAGRDFAPINFAGYFETSINTALVCDLTTTAGLVNLFYVTYTP